MKTALICSFFLVFVATVNGVCDTSVTSCFIDPCLITTCDTHPYAICKANYCNGCKAEFYEGKTIVQC